jgi:hypothetical protein
MRMSLVRHRNGNLATAATFAGPAASHVRRRARSGGAPLAAPNWRPAGSRPPTPYNVGSGVVMPSSASAATISSRLMPSRYSTASM